MSLRVRRPVMALDGGGGGVDRVAHRNFLCWPRLHDKGSLPASSNAQQSEDGHYYAAGYTHAHKDAGMHPCMHAWNTEYLIHVQQNCLDRFPGQPSLLSQRLEHGARWRWTAGRVRPLWACPASEQSTRTCSPQSAQRFASGCAAVAAGWYRLQEIIPEHRPGTDRGYWKGPRTPPT